MADQPIIYIVVAGVRPDTLELGLCAMSEDGDILAGRVVRPELEAQALEAMKLPECVEKYQQAYPLGYELEYIPRDRIEGHAGFQAAQAKFLAANPDAKYDPLNPAAFSKPVSYSGEATSRGESNGSIW